MDIELSIEEEDVGWSSRRERMHNALAARRTAVQQDPAEVYAIARKLREVINGADVDEFISQIEKLADQARLSTILNFQGLSRGSLLHTAAGVGKVDILRLLVDYVHDHLITAQDDWGNTPLHIAAKAGDSKAAAILIRRARGLPDLILRMKNKHENTALHEAVLNCHFNVVRLLLREDLEPVYWKNIDQKSPLCLALDTSDSKMLELLLSLSLEPSRIQGLPPVHGAIRSSNYELVAMIFKKNTKLFAMTDSDGGNAFHIAAVSNEAQVFELYLGPETEYLARERDMNGDLPIHIASKKGNVELIKKLEPVSKLLNGRGQSVLHIAAKYGRTSAVRYILRHPELALLKNERDHAGNTPLHLAAMYSQSGALILLARDERIQPFLLNHQRLTAYDIALDGVRGKHAYRKELAFEVLKTTLAKSRDIIQQRPEARNKDFPLEGVDALKPSMDDTNDRINIRLLVAALVVTVTFAAGFTVPGGFNGSDTASKDERGMATMLDKRMFQAFVLCNTIAMISAMTAAVDLVLAQHNDPRMALTAYVHSVPPLIVALLAMSAAFITGVTLTIGKLPWLANTIFYLGLIFLLIFSTCKLLEYGPFILTYLLRTRSLSLMIYWLVLASIYWWNIETFLYDDREEDWTTSQISVDRPLDGAVNRITNDSGTTRGQ
ncbi:protein ACCELERATED CELL DEATH 6-like [Rhodamnia argentea]|uniref:Protein ACCELERATED CELL DEATH 6-like n=1 Tax=Rhodamnia argentea TaxID=178133 RepID=A0A8B8QB44_9MYRT|nr:protein ACCELERATED CELL DEATH 6-like [Rhodamnia argentea]